MFAHIDLLLALGLGVLGIVTYLIPNKNPLIVITLLTIAFGLSFYIVWTFPWLKESLGRRLAGLLFVAACLCLFGDYVWPQQKQFNDQSKIKKGEISQVEQPKQPIFAAIVPQLQVTPIDIEERLDSTILKFHILNYSNFVAKNISVDIKFGDSLWWKKDLWKASSQDTHNKLLKEKDGPLMAETLSQTNEEELKERHNNYLNRPILKELKPGVKIKAGTMDVNKDWALKQKVFFTASGKTTLIKPEENPDLQESQGWKEQIDKTESGKPIKILFRVIWENEIGKKFDQIFEYQLICTKIGTGKSYNFLPKENNKQL
jgi:hypothetical protein